VAYADFVPMMGLLPAHVAPQHDFCTEKDPALTVLPNYSFERAASRRSDPAGCPRRGMFDAQRQKAGSTQDHHGNELADKIKKQVDEKFKEYRTGFSSSMTTQPEDRDHRHVGSSFFDVAARSQRQREDSHAGHRPS